MKVRLKIRDPSWTDAEGNLFFPADGDDWAEVEVILDGTCEHGETVCWTCADQWAIDWIIHPDDLKSILGNE